MNRFIPRPTLRVVGFDPGPTKTAYAELEVAWPQRPTWIQHGLLASTDDAIRAFLDKLVDGAIVAVEKPSGYIHEHARGAQLLATGNIAGRIAAFAIDRFHFPYEFSAEQWRRQVARNGHASNEAIATALRVLIAEVPRSNEHHRDAAGVALAVAMLQRRIDLRGAPDSRLSNRAHGGNGKNMTSRAGLGR